MCGAGVGVGEGAGSRASTRMASRERGIGAKFGMWFEARAGRDARMGRRRKMGMVVMRILWCGRWAFGEREEGEDFDRSHVLFPFVVQKSPKTPDAE